MKYSIYLIIKKITAWFASILVAMGIGGGAVPEEPGFERPEANSISAYDATKADYSLKIDASNELHEISELLYGVFFEDINFAADGGLYGEKVINRSFEYGELAADDQMHGWSKVGTAETEVKIGAADSLNANNPNYLVIKNTDGTLSGVANKGFLEGMAIEADTVYDFSVYAKALNSSNGKITVRLVADGAVAGESVIEGVSGEWTQYKTTITSSLTASSGVYLQVLTSCGEMAVDMVSLFPPTYKNHGMRMDLAQKIADLEPAFLRFPGGCVIEGYDEETAYSWKDSIGTGADGLPLEFNGKYGDVAARPYGINIWTDVAATEDPLPCYMSYGLGYYEYFQFAEDIGAIGVPVLNCGLYCQMRGKGPVDMDSELFEQYLQDMVDLVEFCRGDETTTWGKVRVSLGHEEPFELKYICIGNENEKEDYYERYEAFLERFNEEKAKNPELYEGLELIYSAGPSEATYGANYYNSYVNAYEYITENGISIDDYAGATDQHYYMDPEWFLAHTDYYDEENYIRNQEGMTDTIYGGGLKVFLGEYAARSNTLEAALAEAAYMTGLERNGDIVEMAAYAPLFGNLTATHWSPNLIWFNNSTSTGSINYYMQKLFSTNAGTSLLETSFTGAEIPPEDLHGMVGIGTWNTSAEFDNVKITDNETGEVLGQDNFSVMNFWWNWHTPAEGDWSIKGGKAVQSATSHDYNTRGTSAYFGDPEWSNFTFEFEATKTDGEEGFFIPFLVEDEYNCFYWNIGGWGNTMSAVQRATDSYDASGALPGTITDFTVETGRTYKIKIVVDGINISGYIDGELQFTYKAESTSNAEAYQVVSTDESGDIIIKLVNVTDSDRTFAIDITGVAEVGSTATVYQVRGDDLGNDNILGAEEDCKMEEFTLDGITTQFNYTAPMYSATVIRITR